MACGSQPCTRMRIVIDPGHGGTRDNGKSTAYGTRGANGQLEKDVTLQLARLVGRHLGGGVFLTRSGPDENPSLAARAEKARGAEVFLSLHAGHGPRAGGTWMHSRGRAASQRLAQSLHAELRSLGETEPQVQRGELAVLSPEYVGEGAAACLVEIGCLGGRFGNGGSLDDAAKAIARGVRRTYGLRAEARPLDDGNYFTDTDQLNAAMTRAGDDRAVSTKADAHAVVQAFRGSTAASPWTSLDRAQVADRLDSLIDDSRGYSQGQMNLCGPAAFFNVWTRRDPVAFANFATELFDTGASSIAGRYDVRPSDSMVRQDYAAMAARMSDVTAQADWMVMGALRNNGDSIFVWSGEPGSSLSAELAGMTTPAEITTWLNATGVYRRVDNQAGSAIGSLSSKGFAPASELEIWPGTDIIVLIQSNMVRTQVGMDKVGFLAAFPNHFVILNEAIIEESPPNQNPLAPPPDDYPPQGRRPIRFNIWTFGRDYQCHVSNMQVFGDNYFGAVVGQMPT